LALQKAAAETHGGAVKGLSASGAHIDLDDQVIQKENKRKNYTFWH